MKTGLREDESAIEIRAAESLRGPGQSICSDCFNRAFDCSIRVDYIDLLGP